MDPMVDGRYRLLERLGTGGMAEVWRARDEATGEEVAVKNLHPHLRADPAALERFRREAAGAAAVRHSRGVAVRTSRVDPEEAYLVMDLVPGPSLARRLAEGGALPAPEAVRIARQVAEVLADAHARGIVHRDVTPANVLLDPVSGARLADFGIARSLEDELALTATGDVIGTFRFMAPETLSGMPASAASDVWSLGAMLYEMLAGRPPFDAASPAALLDAQRRPLPPIDGLPAGLHELLAAMLDPDPAQRLPHGAAAEAALRDVAAVLPPAEPDATTVVPAVAGAAAAPAARPAAPAARPAPDPRGSRAGEAGAQRFGGGRRRALAAIAAVTAGLLALAVLAAGPLGDAADPGGSVAGETATPQPTPTRDAGGGGGNDRAKDDKGKGGGDGDKGKGGDGDKGKGGGDKGGGDGDNGGGKGRDGGGSGGDGERSGSDRGEGLVVADQA